MLKDVVAVEHVRDYVLRIEFEDGVVGEVDIAAAIAFDGVFEPLKDVGRFAEVQLDAEGGTIFWPTGADLVPDVLYALVSGSPLPAFEPGADAKRDVG